MTIRDAAPLDREHDDRDEVDRGAARADDPYLELFEQAPCGYLETTPDGILTRVNRTFERWTGHAREALLGTTFVELLTSSGQLFYETRLAMVLSLSGEVREVALSVRCADDSELPILVNAVAVTGPDGAPRGIRIAVFDATERQDYERQLLLARRGRRGVRGARASAPGRVERVRRRDLGSRAGRSPRRERRRRPPRIGRRRAARRRCRPPRTGRG